MFKTFYIICMFFCFFSLPIKAMPSISDADWQIMNTLPSINGEVNAIAIADNGDVYIGGSFTVLGALSVSGIARWDGEAWWSLESGVAGTVHSIKIHDSQIYIGGSFNHAGGIAAQNIAKWDGSQWQEISYGVNDTVYALDIDADGSLLVAGSFTLAGAVIANGIARWDGTNWSSLGAGVNGDVRALVRHNDELYVGGSFTTAGGITVNRIARWDGNNWFGLATGVNGSVTSLASADGVLFVGGSFTAAAGVAANRVAKWDGVAWEALGSGVSNQVNVLLFDGEALVVGGIFNLAGGQTVGRLAKWNGSAWSGVSGGLNGSVHALGRGDSKLYVGGVFSAAGGVPVEKFAVWDGSNWLGSGDGLNGVINAFTQTDGAMYVAGDFTRIGGIAANKIAKWDGEHWFPLADGLNGVINSLAILDGMLYAAGSFSMAGEVTAHNIARWDGTNWQGLGLGVNGVVNTIVASDTELLVGGAFTQADGIVVNRIARWDGSSWFSLGSGVNNEVRALALMQSGLYAGGSFTMAGGTPVNRLAKWNGLAWSDVSGGLNGVVNTLTVSDSALFVGGSFTTAGGNTANRIAKWAEGSWSSIGSEADNGLSNFVRAIAVKGGVVFTGGAFASAGSISASRIAGWNGSNWFHLGSGVNGNVNSLLIRDNRLYVAGDFLYAGELFSPFFASVDIAAFSYSITYESNGATAGSPPVAQNKDFNSPLILSGNTGGLTKTGHTFNGWNTATDGSGTAFAEGAIYSENASAILYASWLLNQYTITFDSNGGSALATITANFGSTLTAPANPTRERYTFAGWNPAFPESMPASDTTLTAHWELNTFTVRFLDWDETLLQVLQIPDGEAVVLPLLPEREGFRFIGWSEDLGSITSDLDVRALYEELSFEVSVSVSGAAIVTPDRQMVLYGRHATFALNHTNADDVVVVNSDCGASYHAGEIITAPIVAGCSIDVTVYAPVQVEADSTAPGPINQIRRFTVLGGSGEQHLLEADLTRAGRVVPMTEDEINMTLTHLEDSSYRFAASRTGRYSFRFVDDSSGQVVEISFDVLPYLAFASSRQQTEPELATQLSVWLSDEAIFYPVSATLVANDVALNSQVVNIQLEDRLQQNLTATATSDATIWLEADSIVNALPGTPENHRLVVVEEPAPLSLLATALQQDEATLVINRRNGMVLLSVEEQTGVGVSFSWSANGLPLQVDAAQASFDPQNVQLGDYSVLITATDGRRTGQYTLTLRVIDGCNFDSCATISGIPAERNSLRNSRNRLPICPIVEMVTNRVGNCQDQDLLFAEVPLLYTLALGIFSGNTSWSSDQFGLALNDGSLPDEGFTQVGYKVNLDILGLLVPGESVPVMIPFPVGTSIPQDAVWRKFTTMQWHDFVEDENNVLQSAARDALGQCPVVSSDVWEDGLVAGYGCIRLIIEDGGPNDDDAIANGVIRDPGVLAIRNRYTLTFNPNGGSAVAPVTQLFGSALNIAPPVREGHTFIGWSPALPETIPSNNATYTAQWQVNAYQIRFNTAGGQELAPLWVNFGNPIVAPVPVRQGYRFKGWNPSLPATMPAGDLQVTAQWCESEEQLTSKGGSMHVLWLVGLGILAWLRKSRLGLVWLAVQPGNR